MIQLVLSEIVDAIGGNVGRWERGNARHVGAFPQCHPVRGVSTDSRTTMEGELFFALAGPRFDGHAFVAEALRRKAVGAVIASERVSEVAASVADRQSAVGNHQSDVGGVLIAVDNPLKALGRLAAFHRRQLSADVIAVVGSNGKTTTKAMIDHVLRSRLRGRCSPRSFNNAVGVPLTLLSAEASDDYLVVEIGTNRPGEVAELAALAQPKMAVVTCIGEEHLERLGDLDGVAAEECSVLAHLPEGGFAAVNVDWPRVREHLPQQGITIATFGGSAEADLRITEISHTTCRETGPTGPEAGPTGLRFVLNGRFEYRLRMAGKHNAMNAAAAVAVARRWGFEHEEIARRLESFASLPLRCEILEVGGVTVLNDTYNANPASALAAIEALEALPAPGRRIVVFGEMRELGARSAELHRRVAERLRDSSISRVLLVGAAADMMADALRHQTLFGPQVGCCATVGACRERLLKLLQPGDVVLLKASRAVALDRVVESLRGALTTGQETGPTQEQETGPTRERETGPARGGGTGISPVTARCRSD